MPGVVLPSLAAALAALVQGTLLEVGGPEGVEMKGQ
jgi:hypothetical protein